MALSPQIKQLLAAEDELIAAVEVRLEDTLAAIMDQALSTFERNQQFVAPAGDSLGLLLDALGDAWQPGTALGVEHLLSVAQKQDLTTRAAIEYLEAYGIQRTRQIISTTASQLSSIHVLVHRQG